MIRKVTILLAVPMLFLQSCLEDPDPLPQTINTFHYYYNYLLESYDLQWTVDDEVIGTGHSYGVPASAVVALDEVEQDVLIGASNAENGLLIDSLSHHMYENGAYMIAMMGTGEEPHLLCEPMDTRMPTVGLIKYRFLHTAEALGPVDIYIGGSQPEHLVLAEMDYTQVSIYLEATEEQLWTSILLTPANILPADSTILEYKANTIFITGAIYLCTIEHISGSDTSPYQVQVDNQPVFY